MKLLYSNLSRLQANLLKFRNNYNELITSLLIILIGFIIFILGNIFFRISNNLYLILIQQLILILPIAFFLYQKSYSKINLGFNKIKILPTITHIILGFLLFFIANIIILTLQSTLNLSIPGYGEQQSYVQIFQGMNLIQIFLIAGLLVPIVEELLFRGLIFSQTPGSTNFKITISALLFAIFHLQFEVLIPLFMLGLILGYLRKSQNSIYVPILFHILNNCLAIYLTYFLLETT